MVKKDRVSRVKKNKHSPEKGFVLVKRMICSKSIIVEKEKLGRTLLLRQRYQCLGSLSNLWVKVLSMLLRAHKVNLQTSLVAVKSS